MSREEHDLELLRRREEERALEKRMWEDAIERDESVFPNGCPHTGIMNLCTPRSCRENPQCEYKPREVPHA